MADHAPARRVRLALIVNDEPVDVLVDEYKTLLEVLREDLQLTGTKHGCELGECGACAVLVDGEPILSCLALAVESGGRRVTTVEGLTKDGQLDPLQEEFADRGAAQCGYCTPGILLTARALLDREPAPSADRIREALSGNLCRCTGYGQIVEAVEAAAKRSTSADHNSVRPTTTDHNSVRPTTTDHNSVRPTTTDHNPVRPTTTDHRPVQP